MATENVPESSTVTLNGTVLGTPLQNLLCCDAIEPGSSPSYQICKEIYLFHPFGKKMVDTPIEMAMSESREITLKDHPEEVRNAFITEWDRLGADYCIADAAGIARCYGVSALVLMTGEGEFGEVDLWKLHDLPVTFNALDPLNTSGSLVLNQNPDSPAFQKAIKVSASGKSIDLSRACVMFNERPIYISYTPSAFGFSGRSVYQRALFPLKSFIQTMITNDMVSRKAGLLIAFIKSASSIFNGLMERAMGIKRWLLRQADTNNVLSMGSEDRVESLDMQNIDKAAVTARTNIIEDIATGGDMPAMLLKHESFAEGFGEGGEDTKRIVGYIDNIRKWLAPLYRFMDPIVQHRAWDPAFFKSMQEAYPDLYGGRDYKAVFLEWCKAFEANWPQLFKEPDSEMAKHEKAKLEGLVAIYEKLSPNLDPKNAATLAQWVMDNANEYKHLFPIDMTLDIDALLEWAEEERERKIKQEDAAANDPQQLRKAA